jgi:hypothetical protein
VFQLLHTLIVLSLDRRRVVHFGVTPNPTQDWLSRQMTEAFPWDTAPRIYCGTETNPMVRHFVIAFERWGSRKSSLRRDLRGRTRTLIRRECLDHVIIFSGRHLRRVLSSYFRYYHDARTHLSLGKECPRPRQIQLPSAGSIIAFPEVGGLHHRYERRGVCAYLQSRQIGF